MRIFMKRGGAVNVFLTIILVPVLVITCLFVDVSRAKLGRGVVDSAGDLTLNTMLTNYDEVLNDYYGLLASAQDVDTFMETANDYFKACITSQGIDDSDAETYTSDIMALFGGDAASGEIVDLLKMSEASGGEFKVTAMPDGTLENPALVKKEIVEFMKYRAPIDGAMGLIERLQDSKKHFENIDKDADLTEAKEDFLKSEEDLLADLLGSYDSIEDYNYLKINEQYVKDLMTYLTGMDEIYREAHEIMVMDLYNTEGLKEFTPQSINTDVTIKEDDVSASSINGYINNAADSIDQFTEAANSLNNKINAMEPYQGNSNKYYHIQYWKHLVDVLKDEKCYLNFVSKAQSMIDNCEKLNTCYGLLDDKQKAKTYSLKNYKNVNTAGNDTRSSHYSSLISQYNSLKSTYITNQYCAYVTSTNQLSGFIRDYAGYIDERKTYVNSQISTVYTTINDYYSKLEEAEDYLSTAADYLGDADKKYESTMKDYNAWVAEIESYGSAKTELARQDDEQKTEILEDIFGESKVTSENIKALQTRLNNIKSLLGMIKKAIDEYEYNGKPVKDIKDYDAFKKASGVKENKITYLISELDTYKQTSFVFTNSSTVGTINVTQNNNPDLTVNSPKLYTWMKGYKPFQEYYAKEWKPGADETVSNKRKKGESDMEEKKEEAEKEFDENADDANPESSTNITDLSNRPSSGRNPKSVGDAISDDLSGAADLVGDMFSNFSDTMLQLGVDLRDDVYSIDYVMNMFSYQTFENEWKFSRCNSVTMADFDSGDPYASFENDWKSTALTDTYNKSLTNKMINAENNYAYGSEVEYILYGNTNEKNLTSANRSIFAIRFILNLPAEFSRYWSATAGVAADQNALTLFAEGVQTATYGIIPEKLVRLVIIMGLDAAESATDLKILKKGMPVLLVKSEAELEIAFPPGRDGNGIKARNSYNRVKDRANPLAFQYSDYLKLFLMLQVVSDPDTFYLRTMDVIQANMSMENKEKDYVASKSVVYFKAEGTVQVEPLMLDLPIVSNEGYSVSNGKWNTIKYSQIKGY